jgi:hypothetical protein
MSVMRRSGVGHNPETEVSRHRRWRTTDSKRPLEKKTKIPAWFGSEILFNGHREEKESPEVPTTKREDYDGQRCALLTTKSRNTCTRATVFNSSG